MPEEWTTARIVYVKDNVDIFQKKRTQSGFCIDTNFRWSLRGSRKNEYSLGIKRAC